MRKMYSENEIKNMAGGVEPQDVIDIVNDAIGDGDIKAMVLPESAPAAQQLVGVNTSGVQNSLGIGEGLIVEDGKVKENILVVDFNSATSVTNVDLAVLINNKTYDKIRVIKWSNYNYSFDCFKNQVYFNPSSNTTGNVNSLGAKSDAQYLLQSFYPIRLSSAAQQIVALGSVSYISESGIYVYLSANSTSGVIKLVSEAVNPSAYGGAIAYTSVSLTLSGGTLTSDKYPTLDYNWNGKPRPYNNLTYEVVDSDLDSNSHIILRVSRYDFPNRTIYIYGEYINDTTGEKTATYTGTINCTSGVYTITKHSN